MLEGLWLGIGRVKERASDIGLPRFKMTLPGVIAKFRRFAGSAGLEQVSLDLLRDLGANFTFVQQPR